MQRRIIWIPRDWRVWLVAAAAILLLLPIMVAHHLNTVDAPGHAARLAVLREALLNGRPSPYYEITSLFLPNIAFDVIGLGLSWLGGPEVAARLVLGAALVLTLLGTAVLSRVVIGRWSMVSLVAGLFVYNLVVVEGFLNYVFGLALVPWALALRLKLDGSKGHLAGALASVMLLFCHVFAFALYVVMATGFALALWRERKISPLEFAKRLAEFVPSFLLWALMPHDGGAHLLYEPMVGKVKGLFKAVSCGSFGGDIAFLAGVAVFAASLFFARVKLAAGMVPGLILLGILYLVLPYELGHASFIDKRMPIAIAMFLIAGLDVRFPKRTVAIATAVLIATAFVIKQGALAASWQGADAGIDAALAALEAVPPGAEIFRTECHPEGSLAATYQTHEPTLTHVPALATISKDRFYAGNWAIPGQQPIAIRPAYKRAYGLQLGLTWSLCGEMSMKNAVARIRALKDGRPHYLFTVRPDKTPGHGAELLAYGNGYMLYRIEP